MWCATYNCRSRKTSGFRFFTKKQLKFKPKIVQLVHVYGFPAKDTLK